MLVFQVLQAFFIVCAWPFRDKIEKDQFIEGYPGKYIVMARKKDNVWHIVGINGDNSAKEIEIDLSFVTNKAGFIILDSDKGFQQLPISKNTKLKVTMKPYGGFVAKI